MSDEFLKDLLSDVDAIQAPPAMPSQRQRKAFREAIGLSVLDERKIVTLILKILSKGRFDGGDIIVKLNELDVRFELEGEGAIFALLARMEEQDLILGAFDTAMTRKDYWIQDPGSKLLEQNSDKVRSVNGLVSALWAT